MKKINEERDKEFLRLYTEEHWTLQKIGEKFSVSRERVRQIIGWCDVYYEEKRYRNEQANYIIKCMECGKEKLSKYPSRKFCSRACRGLWTKKANAARTIRVCNRCKKNKIVGEFRGGVLQALSCGSYKSMDGKTS